MILRLPVRHQLHRHDEHEAAVRQLHALAAVSAELRGEVRQPRPDVASRPPAEGAEHHREVGTVVEAPVAVAMVGRGDDGRRGSRCRAGGHAWGSPQTPVRDRGGMDDTEGQRGHERDRETERQRGHERTTEGVPG